ncbi:unnamed protein product [Auanema sp. JU1783]|nr:unnamed protein product [Auanema sp. JU1783]
MGLCSSTEVDKGARAAHERIEAGLRAERAQHQIAMKILLLGAGESGKSTVLKQMRIIHQDGFPESEKRSRRSAVYSNTIGSICMLLNGMSHLSIDLSPELSKDAMFVESASLQTPEDLLFTSELAEAIKRLWKDDNVQQAFELRSQFQLNDSAPYFFEALDRISKKDYVPTTQDILMTRVETSGVQEICYSYQNISFRIFDVGGQKSERRKWIHCFDNVNAILFIVAISEYDQQLREDNKTNRMKDSMMLFTDIVNSEFFKYAQVILFLNKKDLFAEKISRVPMTVCFSKYKGKNTYEDGTAFLEKIFIRMKKDDDKLLYIHLTCATDTGQVQFVLKSAADMIISENFRSTGVV